MVDFKDALEEKLKYEQDIKALRRELAKAFQADVSDEEINEIRKQILNLRLKIAQIEQFISNGNTMLGGKSK